MAGSKISSWKVGRLSSYEQIQYHRERRAAARETQQKFAAQAQGFASIQTNSAVELGNIVSRVAMKRITGKLA